MQQRSISVRSLARDFFAPLHRPSSPFQSRSSSSSEVATRKSSSAPSSPSFPSAESPGLATEKQPVTEKERREQELKKKAEEQERQAAYLNGRRLLLPGFGAGGVAKLPQRGIELLWRAYELGHEAALWDLSCCVAVPFDPNGAANRLSDQGALPPTEEAYAIDWTLAVPLYERHAKAGHPIAQKNLGTCYFRGWGVAQSIGKATELYHKAALQNYDVAQYNLGVCYRQGEGVDADPSRMLELYHKAADQGLHAAQCALAKCYLYGRGLKVDWAKATSLMTQAAEGYPAAMVILARWYEVGHYQLMPDARKAMGYAVRAVYEKEIDGWDIILRLLSRYYEEDKRGPIRLVTSLFGICCDYIYEREIVGECLVRSQLMKRSTGPPGSVSAEATESEGRLVLHRELRRRERLMRVLPVDMQDKLRDDRSLCFSPSCSREFYGNVGRVVRRFVMRKPQTNGADEDGSDTGSLEVGLPSSLSSVIGRDEVVLPFCSVACARLSLEPDEQTLG